MNAKDAYIEHLENTIKDLQKQVNNLTEMILLLRKKKFGSSSEKTPREILIFSSHFLMKQNWKLMFLFLNLSVIRLKVMSEQTDVPSERKLSRIFRYARYFVNRHWKTSTAFSVVQS